MAIYYTAKTEHAAIFLESAHSGSTNSEVHPTFFRDRLAFMSIEDIVMCSRILTADGPWRVDAFDNGIAANLSLAASGLSCCGEYEGQSCDNERKAGGELNFGASESG